MVIIAAAEYKFDNENEERMAISLWLPCKKITDDEVESPSFMAGKI